MKFWIVENGRVIFIRPMSEQVIDPKTVKLVIAKAIIAALKEREAN